MKTITDFNNSLLHRRELTVVHICDSNPGYLLANKLVAEHAESPEEFVVINHITNSFGFSEFLIQAFVYDSLESKQKIEPRPKQKKAAGAK